jgi:hypothetical protein
MGRETNLVMQLGSVKNDERRGAKEALKKHLLNEFKSSTKYEKDELKELHRVVRHVNSRLSPEQESK